MKRVCLFLIVMMAARLGLGTTLTYTDDFNDGFRDKTFWKVDNFPGAAFAEMNGRLYGYSGTNHHASGFYGISWKMKAVQMVVKGDVLEVESQFHFPTQKLVSASHQMEIGWVMVSNQYVWCKAVVNNGLYNRVIFPSCRNSQYDVIGDAIVFPPITNFWLKMRYNSATGKAGLWWRPKKPDPWKLATSFNMNEHWGIPLGRLLFLTPYVRFETRDNNVVSPGPYYIDDFTTRLIAP